MFCSDRPHTISRRVNEKRNQMIVGETIGEMHLATEGINTCRRWQRRGICARRQRIARAAAQAG